MTSRALPAASVPRGLGHWNFFFLMQWALWWGGMLRPDLLLNLAFVCALLLPLKPDGLDRLRHLLAVPASLALLYHQSWLPPLERLIKSTDVWDFSPAYLLTLLGRLVHWEWLAAAFILLTVYVLVAPWLRLTTINLGILLYLTAANGLFVPTLYPNGDGTVLAQSANSATTNPQAPSTPATLLPTTTGLSTPDLAWLSTSAAANAPPASDGLLTQLLEKFHQEEQAKNVDYPTLAEGQAFDILFLSICSMSWADLHASNLAQHPWLSSLDIIFDDFNSATSYSGPAVRRLLRANCGQPSHANLYQADPSQCHLFPTLHALGFDTQAALNHNGEFQNFIEELAQEGNLVDPFIPTDRPNILTAFDGSPIWGDFDTLTQWWGHRQRNPAERVALLYNSITLHDGNFEVATSGRRQLATFDKLARTLLDELTAIEAMLKRSGRQILLVLIPEHGAALAGAQRKISGLRDVPTRDVTHVPVGIKLIGAQAPGPAQPWHVPHPTSFLALSELVARMIQQNVFFTPQIDWQTLTQDLPTTPPVSENEGSSFLYYAGQPYVRMGQRSWIVYPQ